MIQEIQSAGFTVYEVFAKREELSRLPLGAPIGTPAGAPTDIPTIVLLHGYGANGRDLIDCASFFKNASQYRWLFPEAPLELESFGSSSKAWFDLDIMAFQRSLMKGEDVLFDQKTFSRIEKLIDSLKFALTEIHLNLNNCILGGFSQGSMVALMAALMWKVPLKGVLLFSSADVYGEKKWNELVDLSSHRAPIFQSHGTFDQVLGYESAKNLHERLRKSNFKVDFHPFQGSHEIPSSILSAAGKWADRCLLSS